MPHRRKVLVVFGTRPEAIKLAPVIRALERSERLRPVVCVTSQHREILEQMLRFFDIRPQYDLGVMRPDQDLSALGARILVELGPVLESERPQALLVQGDTATTFHAALAAYHRRIPCGHVEAGLRSFDHAPFPEEMYRRLTTSLAAWHFAPTAGARDNLLREGVDADRIALTGNTIVDALRQAVRILERTPGADLESLPPGWLDGKRLLLATGHRRENLGPGLDGICEALRALADHHHDLAVVYPVHPNPSVRERVHRLLGGHARIALTPPLDYPRFVALMRRACLILSDSGGVQEEAPSLGIPLLVLRETTERSEGPESGAAQLVGTDRDRIVAAAERLLADEEARRRMATARNPYGDGRAAEAIVAYLERVVPAD